MLRASSSLPRDILALKRAFFFLLTSRHTLLGACVLSDRLRPFRNGVLGQFSGKQQSNGSLDLPTGDRTALVVVGQSRRFGGDSIEDVVHEGIHDRHGLAGDTGVGMDLLEDFVDVDGEGFLPALLPLFFVTGSYSFLGLTGLFNGFT